MKAFITVIGHDTVGVVAKVAALCSELNINIEDVTQSILQGMFAMIMLVDISHCSVSHEELHNRTDALAKEMGMQINVTRQASRGTVGFVQSAVPVTPLSLLRSQLPLKGELLAYRVIFSYRLRLQSSRASRFCQRQRNLREKGIYYEHDEYR